MTPYAPGAWAYGGIPRLVGAIVRGLVRRGHAVTVCTTDACDADTRLPPGGAAATATDDGVDWRVFPNLSNRLAYHRQFFTPVGLSTYLRDHAAWFDAAHVHGCRNLPGVLAARHLHRAGVPYILAPNGTAPIIERAFLAKRAFDVALGHRVMRNAAGVVAVARAEARQLTAIGVPADRVHVIPNPLDLDELIPPVMPDAFRARAGLGAGPLVLFLGKLTPRKRLDVLVEAFALAGREDARLVIAGNDMGARPATERAIARCGIGGRTTFTGLLRGRDRLEALRDASVVVYPSEHEIFGLVPMEALLVGTPVIVAGDSGCGEVISELDGGAVVPVGDVGALAVALRQVLDAPEAARMRATTAAALVRASYGGDAIASRLEELYRGVIGTATRLKARA